MPQHAGQALAAVALHAPYLGTAHHHASSRQGLAYLEEAFFGIAPAPPALRVLCFSDTYDELNGVAGTMRRLSAEGARRGELTVVTSREQAVDEPGLLAVPAEWSIPLPGYESIELRVPALLELLSRIERERPTVIHVATPGPIGLAGLLIARVLGVPVVGSYHTELAPYALHLTRDLLVSELTRVYVDWFYRQCAIVLAPTTPVAKSLRDRQYPKQIRVWGRNVDVAHFRPARRSLRLRRSLLGEQGDLLLLSVGRVSPEKRLDVLLDAYALLRQRHPGARLAIAGDGPAREELEAAAPPGVRFLGAVEGDALARLYASADVFCFASTTDTFGQVLLEAGASGLPVVATRTGGTAELVEHRRNGLLVAPDDPDAFARALRRLATQAERRRELGNQGRIRAAARTSERSFGELWAAYRDAAGASTETLSDLVR